MKKIIKYKIELNSFKSDVISLIVLFILTLIIMKIVLHKESVTILFKVILKLFYVIIIPGLFISLYLYKKLSFMSRLIFGSVLTIALISIISYYLGLIGLHIKYHPYILPPFLILIGILLFLKKKRN